MVSAGALHPIEVIVLDGEDVGEPILFCDRTSRFVTLPVRDPSTLKRAIVDTRHLVNSDEGHLILFVGDKRRVDTAYETAESLLWRDAGAALQACSMAACAYGYAFCPLGHTGAGVLSALEPPHEGFTALSLAVFGRLTDQHPSLG